MLLSAVANVTQTVVTNKIEQKCSSTSQLEWSAITGATAGLISGPVTRITVFEESSQWLDAEIAHNLNQEATTKQVVGVENLLRSVFGGLISNFPTLFGK